MKINNARKFLITNLDEFIRVAQIAEERKDQDPDVEAPVRAGGLQAIGTGIVEATGLVEAGSGLQETSSSAIAAQKQQAVKYAFRTEYGSKSSFAEGSNLEEIKASIAHSYELEDTNMHLKIKTGPESFSQLDSQDAMSGYLRVIGYSKDHVIIVEHKAEVDTTTEPKTE